eukprot:795873-Alexandrium_andersonii.AAC.1
MIHLKWRAASIDDEDPDRMALGGSGMGIARAGDEPVDLSETKYQVAAGSLRNASFRSAHPEQLTSQAQLATRSELSSQKFNSQNTAAHAPTRS